MKPWLIQETNWKAVQETRFSMAVIPWGATEAHNYHLPYGTDNYMAEYVAGKAAELAWEKGVKVAVLPVIPLGVNAGQLDLTLTINLNPSTQMAILKDILDSLHGQGIRKYLIVNGHGGNDFKQMIRELQPRYSDSFIGQVNWYNAVPLNSIFKDSGEHAGEAETSAMLAIHPSLVRPLKEAGDGAHKKLPFPARAEGWFWAPRPWSKVSKDTGIGNPSEATAEKGKIYLEQSIRKIAELFIQLSETEIDALYQ